jgi:hypothetical protein
MVSPHLVEEFIGGVVDLDLLFKIPQKYTRIIGGKGEEASSRGSTMEVRERLKNTLEHTQTVGEEAPFIANRNRAVGGKNRSKVGLAGLCAGPPGAQPGERQDCAGNMFWEGFWRSPSTSARPSGVQPGAAGLKPAAR